MKTGPYTWEEFWHLLRVAQEHDLGSKRSILLANVPRSVWQSIPSMVSRQDQLHVDLEYFASRWPKIDALSNWLRTALHLAPDPIFVRALERLAEPLVDSLGQKLTLKVEFATSFQRFCADEVMAALTKVLGAEVKRVSLVAVEQGSVLAYFQGNIDVLEKIFESTGQLRRLLKIHVGAAWTTRPSGNITNELGLTEAGKFRLPMWLSPQILGIGVLTVLVGLLLLLKECVSIGSDAVDAVGSSRGSTEVAGATGVAGNCSSDTNGAEDFEACAVGIVLGVQATSTQACVEVAPILSVGVRAAINVTIFADD